MGCTCRPCRGSRCPARARDGWSRSPRPRRCGRRTRTFPCSRAPAPIPPGPDFLGFACPYNFAYPGSPFTMPSMPDSEITAAKDRTRRVWGIGDYTRIAQLLEPAAAALIDACAVSAGQEVLDVAAGSGNFAVLAAREGASVMALDLSPDQVELGRARCEAEGLSVEWVEGDAEDLPFEDERF